MTTKRERLEATIAGEKTDRSPVALWQHWPVDDQYTEALADSHVKFQKDYDFDFIKITMSSSYCLTDYGQQTTWRGTPEGTRDYDEYIIQFPDDWLTLHPLDPHQGFLGDITKSVELIGKNVGSEVPFIPTIFNPLAQAKNLAGDKLIPHLRQYPEAVKAGLATLTENTIRFIEAVKPSGIAGVFFATQHAQYHLLSEKEYKTFGMEYDLEILSATDDLWLNVLHIHGLEVMFDLLANYPIQVINWHDQETYPTLAEGKEKFQGAVCGGLHRWNTLVRGTPDMVRDSVKQAIESTHGGNRLIVGTGCVTPIITPVSNIRAVRESV
ncbi:MAG: hypothetical protein B6242_01805 [Anaerolineaceae bacterium 4572_78]|nr:MAG: hypothetical protein B6242_01805 [Anaerolineaceae bacterium 4572_78]